MCNMPEQLKDLPPGENCGSCYFGRSTQHYLACCYYPPVTHGTAAAGAARFPPVDSVFGWCGQWSQTPAKTSVVLQTTAVLVRNSTAATLGDTTGLISGKYYAIVGSNIPAGTLFAYTGAVAIQLSSPATANGTVNVAISDSY
jgi:hypothetical protein